MLVEVNFGLLSKYLLFLDCAFMFFCAQLIYIRDIDTGVFLEPDKSLTVLNAKIFFYSNSFLASVIYFYWLLKHDYLLTLFVLGILGHLVCRICFAYYFFFFLNFANLMGLLCGGYYRYLLWYDLDSHTVVNVPAFWSFTEEETDDEDGDKSSKRRKKSQRSKRYRKESSSDDIA